MEITVGGGVEGSMDPGGGGGSRGCGQCRQIEEDCDGWVWGHGGAHGGRRRRPAAAPAHERDGRHTRFVKAAAEVGRRVKGLVDELGRGDAVVRGGPLWWAETRLLGCHNPRQNKMCVETILPPPPSLFPLCIGRRCVFILFPLVEL